MFSQNNLCNIFIGKKANQVGLAYNYFESENFFEEDDILDHKNIFKNIKKKTPRCIQFGLKGEIETLNYLNESNIEKDKKEQKGIKNKVWKEGVQLIGEEEFKQDQVPLSDKNPFYDLAKNVLPDKKFMLELPNIFDDDFQSYGDGKTLFFKDSRTSDIIEDTLRYMLEENDYLEGFQLFSDTDNGFSSFTNEFIDILNDECNKKTKILFSITDSSKIDQTRQKNVEISYVNNLHTLTQLRSQVTAFFPIDMANMKLVDFYNFKNTKNDEFTYSCALAPILSNITQTYRIKGQKSISDFYNGLIDYYHQNIFNISADIPLIDSETQKIEQQLNIQRYNYQIKKIFQFYLKKYFPKRKDFFSMVYFPLFDHSIQSFRYIICYYLHFYSESIMLRCTFDIPKTPPYAKRFNVCNQDYSYNNPTIFPNSISSRIQNFYCPPEVDDDGQIIQQEENLQLAVFPLHTSIYSHESFKYIIKNTENQFLQVNKSILSRFQEKNDISIDDLSEMQNQLKNLYDNFDQKQ